MRSPSRTSFGVGLNEGTYWESQARIMRTLVPFPGLPSPGRGMSGVIFQQYFKIRVGLISLPNDPWYARIFAQQVPHLGVIPKQPPYMAATNVLITGL